MKPKIWTILSDIHAPYEHKPSMKAVFDFLSKNRVDGVVLLGDNMDCESISRHTKGLPGLRRPGGWQAELDHFDLNILKPLETRLKRGCQKVFFMGNHEDWLEDLLAEQPELKGALSIEKSLQLISRGWKVVKIGGHYNIGKAYLVHGDQVGSSMHVSKKLVDAFCATSIMGHVHSAQMHTKTSQVKKRDKWAGYVIPTLGTVAPKYAKGKANAHINGFGIVEEWPNGNINVYIVIISDGRFSYGGRLYGR